VREDGALLVATVPRLQSINYRPALCGAEMPMSGTDEHYLEISIVALRGGYPPCSVFPVPSDGSVLIGVARPRLDVELEWVFESEEFWGVESSLGAAHHADRVTSWTGQQPFDQGDTLGLLLDCSERSLALYKNGERLGVVAGDLPEGPLCWAVAIFQSTTVQCGPASDVLRVVDKPPPVSDRGPSPLVHGGNQTKVKGRSRGLLDWLRQYVF
jgi:hypothetical protein